MARINRSFWTVVHIFNLVLHIGLIITSGVAFVANGQSEFDKFRSGRSNRHLVFLPWASFGVGILGVAFNQFLLAATRSAMNTRYGTEQDRHFRKLLSFSIGWFFGLAIFAADVAVAVALKANVRHSTMLYGPFIFSALAASVTALMIVLDIMVFFEERRDYLSVIEPEDGALQI